MRYNKTGVSDVLFKNLINNIKCVSAFDVVPINIPKPFNNKELEILSEFIFGTKLQIDFESFYRFVDRGWYDQQKERKIKLALLKIMDDSDDFIRDEKRENKLMILLRLRYNCTVYHNKYYDSTFEKLIFGHSLYNIDHIFWICVVVELVVHVMVM